MACECTPQELKQCCFLGLSVQSFSATLGWGGSTSELSVVLVEDQYDPTVDCPKQYLDETLTLQEITSQEGGAPSEECRDGRDPGFHGEYGYTYEDANGVFHYYSDCVRPHDSGGALSDEDIADLTPPFSVEHPTHSQGCKIKEPDDPTPMGVVMDVFNRKRIDLVGLPVMFRCGAFEFSGILSDWVKDIDPNNGTSYRVKVVDPRFLLENSLLIIGEYDGQVDANNVFNLYGLAEATGTECKLMGASFCEPFDDIRYIDDETPFDIMDTVSLDGPMFGSYAGAFGGSKANENGMPLGIVIQTFDNLVNSGFDSFPFEAISFVNRGPGIKYCGYQWDGTTKTCGLIPVNVANIFNPGPDAEWFTRYYVDITELSTIASCNQNMRITGTVITVMDFIQQVADKFGFDFYFELLPTEDTAETIADESIINFIKLRIVKSASDCGDSDICDFINSQKCATRKEYGRELANEITQAVLDGDYKRFVHQVLNTATEECDITSGIVNKTPAGLPNDITTNDLSACWGVQTIDYTETEGESCGPLSGSELNDLAVLFPCPQDGDIYLSYTSGRSCRYKFDAMTLQWDLFLGDEDCCSATRNVLPYFGVDAAGDLIIPCLDDQGFWYFWADTTQLNQSLNTMQFPMESIVIHEAELIYALVDFDAFYAYIRMQRTELFQVIFTQSGKLSLSDFDEILKYLLSGEGAAAIGRDVKNPRLDKHWRIDDPLKGHHDDLQIIYNWVKTYATEYYGKKFAVRAKHVCFSPDHDDIQACNENPAGCRRTGVETNVKPAPDGGWTEQCSVLGIASNNSDLEFFRNEEGLYAPFVRFYNFAASNQYQASAFCTGDVPTLEIARYDEFGNFVEAYYFEIETGLPAGTVTDETVFLALCRPQCENTCQYTATSNCLSIYDLDMDGEKVPASEVPYLQVVVKTTGCLDNVSPVVSGTQVLYYDISSGIPVLAPMFTVVDKGIEPCIADQTKDISHIDNDDYIFYTSFGTPY